MSDGRKQNKKGKNIPWVRMFGAENERETQQFIPHPLGTRAGDQSEVALLTSSLTDVDLDKYKCAHG